MEKNQKNNRLQDIRMSLRHGDITQIARKASVHREWVSMVLLGRGVSNRILAMTEEHINNRISNQNNSHENTN